MGKERKVGRRFPDNLLALILTGCAIAGVSAFPRIISAQIPDSKPKPGLGGVVKLHGQPYLVVSLPSGMPYQLSGGCVLGRPVLTFTVQLSNKGTLANRAQPPETVAALDDTIFPERWQGQASLPEIPPGQSVSISILSPTSPTWLFPELTSSGSTCRVTPARTQTPKIHRL
jgi:hypothetical protein